MHFTIQLAQFHGKNGNVHECVRHCRVAASAGDQESMDRLMKMYKNGLLSSKEDLTQTLREFQASVNEMKSKDRDDFCAMRATVEGRKDM